MQTKRGEGTDAKKKNVSFTFAAVVCDDYLNRMRVLFFTSGC
jgi:hypothetical protein